MESIPSQALICALFLPLLESQGEWFQKYRPIWARPAEAGEEIRTCTSDGLETCNTANSGDFIVRNQTAAGELYVMARSSFEERYTPTSRTDEKGFREYLPTGKILAIELTEELLKALGLPPTFEFIASWGSGMVAKTGDYMVCPPDRSSVYRIARREFFETYRPVIPAS